MRVRLPGVSGPPSLSFFGQGLTVVMDAYPGRRWARIPGNGERVAWAMDDATEVLSEFYAVSVGILDAVYETQQDQAHDRNNLAETVLKAPIYSM